MLLELNWYGEGNVYFQFPLEGADEAIYELYKKFPSKVEEAEKKEENSGSLMSFLVVMGLGLLYVGAKIWVLSEY
jgi:hypothetical protein